MTRMIKRATLLLLLLLSFTGCATHHGVSSSADINSTASALHIYRFIMPQQIKVLVVTNDWLNGHFN
jgi:predicted small secreted protein